MNIVYKNVANLNLAPEVKSKLSFFMHRLEIGNSTVLRTPIGKGLTTEAILDGLDKIVKANSVKFNSVLTDLENSQRAKFGPRSIAKPFIEISSSLIDQFAGDQDNIGVYNISDLGNNTLRPISFINAVENLKNSTNAGLPYLVRKGDIKSNYKESTWLDELSKDFPAVPFIRTQEQGKTRLVWGMPISSIVRELRYYVPLFNLRKNLKYRSSLSGPDSVAKRMTEFILRSIRDGLIILSMDFSEYDKSLRNTHVKRTFGKFESYFQKSEQTSDDLKSIADNISGIGICLPDGTYTSGFHGLSSGSQFTNDVGSDVQYNIATSTGLYLDIDVNGDDGVVLLETKDVENYITAFIREGFTVNIDKTYKAQNFCVYLQNLYHIDYIGLDGIIGGIYPIYRALNRIVFPERWANFEEYGLIGKDFYSIRTILILENCKYHPLHYELVKYVYELDKYSLEYADNAVSKYASFIFNTEGISGQLINQYSDDIFGIKSFKTVSILKELAKEGRKIVA